MAVVATRGNIGEAAQLKLGHAIHPRQVPHVDGIGLSDLFANLLEPFECEELQAETAKHIVDVPEKPLVSIERHEGDFGLDAHGV